MDARYQLHADYPSSPRAAWGMKQDGWKMVDLVRAILYYVCKRANPPGARFNFIMATAATSPSSVQIPDRLYFRIGDVCRLAGLKAHVLRYWESEFSWLSPKKSGSNQRLYRRKDVELVLELKRLLYDQKFTIQGAREYLQKRKLSARQTPAAARVAAAQGLLFDQRPEWLAQVRLVRNELLAIAGLLG
jgi:DNA-binding transcriptional MerR regulator